MDDKTEKSLMVKTLLVTKETHKQVKLESVKYEMPLQEIVSYKILKLLTKEDIKNIRKGRKK